MPPSAGAVFQSPYAPPPQGFLPQPPARPSSSTLGVVALVVALVATVVASLVGALAAVQIGPVLGPMMRVVEVGGSPDLRFLTPVRSWVLLAEIAFWVGTALGIWALVQGIVAIVRRSGTGFGIAAVIVAVLGPVVFTTLVGLSLTMSAMSGLAR